MMNSPMNFGLAKGKLMKYLLDTHTFIWMDSDKNQLSERVQQLCQDPTNQLLLSVVSLWEIVTKAQIGKFTLRQPLLEIVEEHVKDNYLQILPVTLPHVLELQNLPLHHKDPFDRMLIAQATTEGATLLSKDGRFTAYKVDVIW